jgi:hypothetical protein
MAPRALLALAGLALLFGAAQVRVTAPETPGCRPAGRRHPRAQSRHGVWERRARARALASAARFPPPRRRPARRPQGAQLPPARPPAAAAPRKPLPPGLWRTPSRAGPAPHPHRPAAPPPAPQAQFTQVKLPVALDGVEPVISKQTMDYHYNK